MSKTVLTVKDILKRKEFFENKKNETLTLNIPELDSNIVIYKPDKELCTDCLDMEDSSESDRFMVYEIVKEPNLKDKELQEAFGCTSPLDIVDKIFSPGAIVGITQEALKFAGYNTVKVVTDIKN